MTEFVHKPLTMPHAATRASAVACHSMKYLGVLLCAPHGCNASPFACQKL